MVTELWPGWGGPMADQNHTALGKRLTTVNHDEAVSRMAVTGFPVAA
jgi:hypothetical protein